MKLSPYPTCTYNVCRPHGHVGHEDNDDNDVNHDNEDKDDNEKSVNFDPIFQISHYHNLLGDHRYPVIVLTYTIVVCFSLAFLSQRRVKGRELHGPGTCKEMGIQRQQCTNKILTYTFNKFLGL